MDNKIPKYENKLNPMISNCQEHSSSYIDKFFSKEGVSKANENELYNKISTCYHCYSYFMDLDHSTGRNRGIELASNEIFLRKKIISKHISEICEKRYVKKV